ncbi:MAG: hypothetical protein JWQ25_2866 [Daejeonella sp.]|nr:hypothetical protein [Daejeonella sp.]
MENPQCVVGLKGQAKLGFGMNDGTEPTDENQKLAFQIILNFCDVFALR